MCTDAKEWHNRLPLVLLGLRTAYREDLKCSSAELIYVQALRVPGEFYDLPASNIDRTELAAKLHKTFADLKAPAASRHTNEKAFVHPKLKDCSHVFIRVDAVKKPLQQPFEGPYKVIARNEKCFDILISGKKVTVSINRIKPAHIYA
ncbi:uncharacterized protein LOC129725102 [Wyeomyia smithii]|uniref:uncharacterized protein LOC129725102 n=1 Tax=Wyeomyia smithii TaxID=174621 RepID=UPI0024680E9C|nr:uncharacterized protein LOC129725102 [Wyeomyia smithii]